MIRVGAVGQNQRPASDEASLDIRAEAAQPFLPRPRVAVDVSSAVRPPAA